MRMAKCIVNLDTLNRISNIFPCVAWKDYAAKNGQRVLLDINEKAGSKSSYFDTNTDYNFHKILNDAVSSGKSDYDIIIEFYNFKNTKGISESRKKIFDYLLPPEDQFLQIDKSFDFSYLTSKGIYIFFNKFFVEKTFNKNLEELISTQLPPGEEFPLYKAYDSSEWLCYYNNNSPRFTWNQSIDWRNFAYSPNTPWEGFEHYCQYNFTLVRLGYENCVSNNSQKNMTKCVTDGKQFLCDFFCLDKASRDYNSDFDKVVPFEFSDYEYLHGNINYGIEMTNPRKDVYYIKSFKDTELQIRKAIKYKKYQEMHDFIFSYNDRETINKLYDKYFDIMPAGSVNEYGILDFKLRYEELNKVLSFLIQHEYDKKDENTIRELQEKIESKKMSFGTFEEGEQKDPNQKKNEERKQALENYKIEETRKEQTEFVKDVCLKFLDKFSSKEAEYKKWIMSEVIEKEYGIIKFMTEMKCLYNNNFSSAIFSKYQQMYNCDIDFIDILIKRFSTAYNEVREEYDE